MPNTPVLVAATGLPTIRPSLSEIMVLAHDYACEMPERLSYADRFRVALRRAWREAKAHIMKMLRELVEDRVERLLAFLDALDGDADLEPSLGSHGKFAVDAEADCADDEFSLGSLDDVIDQSRWAEDGRQGDYEASGELDDLPFPITSFEAVNAEAVAVREAADKIGAIVTRLKGREVAIAVRL